MTTHVYPDYVLTPFAVDMNMGSNFSTGRASFIAFLQADRIASTQGLSTSCEESEEESTVAILDRSIGKSERIKSSQ